MEPELYPHSDWESIIVTEKSDLALRLDRRDKQDDGDQQLIRINYWDIIFEENPNLALPELAQ